ncbi:MAG: DUF1830 domain-containing protein [Cyanobacteria bacterium P01_G01_bin.67]
MQLVDRTITQPISEMLCHYHNPTHKMQMIRVVDCNNHSYEKVVFPQQRILFAGIKEGYVEVYVEHKGKPMLKEILYCHNLQATVIDIRQPYPTAS